MGEGSPNLAVVVVASVVEVVVVSASVVVVVSTVDVLVSAVSDPEQAERKSPSAEKRMIDLRMSGDAIGQWT